MHTIEPYKEGMTWFFDDPSRNVRHEPFNGDINRMIDRLVMEAKIKDPHKGFRATFSDRQFPEIGMVLRRVEPTFDMGSGSAWYSAFGMRGWLCPVLKKYFEFPPSAIYVKAEPLGKKSWMDRLFNWMYRNSIELP